MNVNMNIYIYIYISFKSLFALLQNERENEER